MLRFVGIASTSGARIVGIKQKCPHCDELVSRGQTVCNHCGRDIPLDKTGKGGDVEKPLDDVPLHEDQSIGYRP
ncbi:MAG: hypothetical protein IH840_05965 [Candidatus Heimdallarchaeota archaeon]|nr:hypothetical protein [Candidatus Heimdallarchaeota archaeon]